MKIQRKSLIRICLVFLVSALPLVSWAQPAPEGDGEDPDEDPAPIDGGISLVIAAGVAYGAKKLYDIKNIKQEQKTD